MLIGTQSYVWYQIYVEQRNLPLLDHLDEILAQVRAAGMDAYESGILSAEHAALLKQLLPKHQLQMPSIYVGPALHDPATSDAEIEAAIAKARSVQSLGTTIVVCNPAPLSWSEPLNKSDDQLKHQADALDRLGRLLRADGFTLAYHTHATEMRCSAREFHHMLLATDPAHVGLCLDTHWVYRGAGNSQVALGDIVKLYAPRLKSLHLRQSHNGVWSETFMSTGDIDYRPLASTLQSLNFTGPLILEQCFEPGTPSTLTPEERHRQSLDHARTLFAT